jgi:uncharacterized protein YjiS (DUF1127 family)
MLSTRLVARIIHRLFSIVRTWRANVRQRRELLMFDAVELRDIRLTDADLHREATEYFWKNIRLSDR